MNRNRLTTILLILAGLLAGFWLGHYLYDNSKSLAAWHLDDDQSHMWEVILKAAAGYLTLMGTFVAVFKYMDERVERNEAAQRESRKAFFEKRQDVYFRLGLALARIMNHDPDDSNDHDWIPAKEQFYSLYWGEISLVSDQRVTESVEKFSNALHSVTNKAQKDALANLCVAIMLDCRRSLGDTWNVEQGSIDNIPFSGVFSRYWQEKGKLSISKPG